MAQSNSVSWINPSGGDWDDPSNWSDDTVPTAGNDVSISIAVSNPITHSSAVADAVSSLTSSDPIMLLAGSLTIGTTADLSASMTLDGGEIDGGTINLTNGAELVVTGNSNNTLAGGVTIDGTVDMATNNAAQLTVTGGLTLDGTILMGDQTGYTTNGILNFVGAQTLAGTGTIDFGFSGFNQINTATSGGSDTGTLTIGAGITIEGNTGYIGYNDGLTQTPLVIQGTVDADTGGGTIQMFGSGWSSSGNLEASGGSLDLFGTNWTSSGTISATSGGYAEAVGTWTDSGVISADSSSIVDLYGTFSVGSSASFSGSGTVDVNGTIENSGGTVTLDDSGLVFALNEGTIDGGDIETTDGAALFATDYGGTLDGVTLDGTLDMTGYYPSLDVTGGLTLDHGTIDIGTPVDSGIYRQLIFQGAQTLGGSGSIVFGGNGNNAIDTESSGGDSGTLTIGPNVTIGGDDGFIGFNNNNSEIETPIVIQGTVDSDTSGGESPSTARGG